MEDINVQASTENNGVSNNLSSVVLNTYENCNISHGSSVLNDDDKENVVSAPNILNKLVPDVVFPKLQVHEYSIATAYVRNKIGVKENDKVLFVFRGPPKTIHGRFYDYTGIDKNIGDKVIISGMKKLKVPDYVKSAMANNVKIVYIHNGCFIGTGKIDVIDENDNSMEIVLSTIIAKHDRASIGRIIERIYENFKMSDEFDIVKAKTIAFKKHCILKRVVNAEVTDGTLVRSFIMTKMY
jgi:hypothetical protein